MCSAIKARGSCGVAGVEVVVMVVRLLCNVLEKQGSMVGVGRVEPLS